MGAPRPAQRQYLDVPFAEKDQAKALGARWDPAARRWWSPPAAAAALQQWAARPEIPELLPGEDRTFGSGLFTDLVPSSCWFSNVRSCVAAGVEWERLRRMLLARAGRRCEICGRGEDRAVQRWLEAHERWAYDEQAGVQSLRRLIIVCSDCHRSTHYGLASVQGRGEEAFAHLCAVTGMSVAQADAHIEEAFALWRRRNLRAWALDLSILTDAGIAMAPPPDHDQRPALAEQRLGEQRAAEQRGVEYQPREPHPDAARPWVSPPVPRPDRAQAAAESAATEPAAPVAPRRWWQRGR